MGLRQINRHDDARRRLQMLSRRSRCIILTTIAEAILSPAGALVALFVKEGSASFPIYRLFVSLVALALIALMVIEGTRAWHDAHR
jgi:hypothetical protein